MEKTRRRLTAAIIQASLQITGAKKTKTDDSYLMDPYSAQEMQEAFSLFDKNGDGKICANELKSVMRALGQNPSEKNITEMMAKVDKDNNGSVDYDEYCELIRGFCKPPETVEIELREAFRHFDKDRNGSLDAKELKGALMSLGDPLAEEDINELLSMMDADKNGKIDVEEFTKFLCEPAVIKKSS
ncbi:hypothetical protein CHS0354_003930 [Potamilus streckersoni]|uniref:EF-hand domain-containing protein n=1 Tax=Potamilus streckersoni TaxID=2493646 RepID=A0AAE0S3Q3_9BIVA|nr:hypothetical protein CHS0354_003930 [Potamilus streckersoni]